MILVRIGAGTRDGWGFLTACGTAVPESGVGRIGMKHPPSGAAWHPDVSGRGRMMGPRSNSEMLRRRLATGRAMAFVVGEGTGC